jgi:hypothetical protein
MALNLSSVDSYIEVPYKAVLNQKDSNIQRAPTENQEFVHIYQAYLRFRGGLAAAATVLGENKRTYGGAAHERSSSAVEPPMFAPIDTDSPQP